MRILPLFAGLLALTVGTTDGFAAAPCETAALQGEIDRLAAAGGGTLTVGAGVHRTGALFFRPGVNLHLEKDAVLLGSDAAADYPIRETRLGGRTFDYYPAMLNADRCDGFRITGEGVVDGHGLPTWRAYWTAAGNEGEFYAYSEKDEPNLGGHRIWRKFDDPHRLLAHLETKILGFLKGGRQ